jgi:hypothetical protein
VWPSLVEGDSAELDVSVLEERNLLIFVVRLFLALLASLYFSMAPFLSLDENGPAAQNFPNEKPMVSIVLF